MHERIVIVTETDAYNFQERVNSILEDGGMLTSCRSGVTSSSEWFHAIIKFVEEP